MSLIVSPAGRRYGRIKPPSLRRRLMLSQISENLPKVVDLRQWCGPIKNQQQLGSCTGHAGSSAIEWICRRYLGKSPVLSPLYFYSKELIADGDFPNDDGSTGLTLCGVAVTNGCCEDSLYPDASQVIEQPTAAMDENAAQYRMGAYHGLTGSQVALSVLGDPTPWPVEIGFDVPASFESDETAETGIMIPLQPGQTPIGGHETVASCGYDIGPVPTLRPNNCPPALLIQNSWGLEWGWNGSGLFWMPLAVLDAPNTDLKIVHAGNPWP